MKATKGFTLIELMIVVVVIAILSAVGIPAYTNYVTRGKLIEASSGLSNGRVKMEQFYQDNRTYVGAPCPGNTGRFTIACEFNAADYTITATGFDNMATFVYTIDETDARTTAGPWGSGNCWISRKGDAC